MDKQSRKHSAIATICSIFLMMFLVIEGTIISLKTGIFSGEGDLGLANNNIFSDAIRNSIDQESSTIYSKYGYTEETFNSLMGTDYKDKIATAAANALNNNTESVDLSFLKLDLNNFCKNTTDFILDDYIKNLEKANGNINTVSICDNSIAKKLQENSGLDFDSQIKSAISLKYPTASSDKGIDMANINKEDMKTSLSSLVNDGIKPQLNLMSDDYISGTQKCINQMTFSMNTPRINLVKKIIRFVNNNSFILLIAFALSCALLFGIQFVFYRGYYRHKPFVNLMVVSIISTIIFVAIGFSNKLLPQIYTKIINRLSQNQTYIKNALSTIVQNCLRPFLIVGASFFVITVISFVFILTTKKRTSDD